MINRFFIEYKVIIIAFGFLRLLFTGIAAFYVFDRIPRNDEKSHIPRT